MALDPLEGISVEDSLAQQEGSYEPQRAFTWVISIYGLQGSRALELSLRTGFLPTDGSEEIEIPYMSCRIYVAGKKTLDSGTLTFVDYVDRNISGIIAAWRKMVFDPETGAVGYASKYKKTANVTLYSPDFSVERVWLIKGLWPQNVVYGQIDYATSDVVNVECTMRYDRAIPQFLSQEVNTQLGSIPTTI